MLGLEKLNLAVPVTRVGLDVQIEEPGSPEASLKIETVTFVPVTDERPSVSEARSSRDDVPVEKP